MITMKNVSFSYAGCEQDKGVKDISLTIPRGEVILLCGHSGCGKTTLTRLINGLIPHYYEGKLSGGIFLDGKEIPKAPLYETAGKVGSVFQNPRSQFFNVDTSGELAFAAENMGLPPKQIKEMTAKTVTDFCIQNLVNRNLFQLSGGEKQKIACASVSVCEPPVMVLDEPSSNLDTASIEELRKIMKKWKKQGKTIVIAEHRIYFLKDLVDRVLYMEKGKIVLELGAEELKMLPDRELTRLGLRPLYLESLVKKQWVGKTEDSLGKLVLNHFNFAYKGAKMPVLEIEELELPLGSIVAVVGPNGAGKSTFSHCLCGLEKRCKGSVAINDRQLNSKQRLKKCYMVMQDVNHQLFTESVLEEVLLSMAEQTEEKAEDILAGLDLLSMKELHPMSLSGGEKQRVAIASAIAGEREIIVFDEPTSGLDLRHMKEVSQCLRQLQASGKTLFIISHDLELILECCTYILQFEKGKIMRDYPLNETGEAEIKKFFISHPMSLVCRKEK